MGSPSQTKKLAIWFVREILGREWRDTDFRGPVMRHAKSLLSHYDADVIAGCLEANRDGLIGDGYEIQFLSSIESSGEPPLLQQFLDYCANPPAVYLAYETEQWLARKDKHYPELEPDLVPDKPKPTRKKKTKATQLELG